MELSAEEKNQYSRHLLLTEIGEEGQLKLKEAKVLVIGAGGLGCPVLQYLTAAGVGTIGIVDGDVVATSNLQRQILFTTADVGKSKAMVAAERLRQLNPFIQFAVFNTYSTTKNIIELCSAYNIIVDGTDNFESRYLINDAAVITNKPVVFGSIYKFQGQVSVFNFKGSATYRCLYPDPPSASTIPNCSEVGVLGVLPGIVGALQANEVIKLITEIGEPLVNKLLHIDALTLEQQILTFKQNSKIQITELQKDYQISCSDDLNKLKSISAEAYKTNKENYYVLDVRTMDEFEAFNTGAHHIPLAELEARMGELPNDKPLLVLCASGKRSLQAVKLLKAYHYPDSLFSLEGGIAAI